MRKRNKSFNNSGGLWMSDDPDAEPRFTGQITIHNRTYWIAGHAKGSAVNPGKNPMSPTISLRVTGAKTPKA